jgi:hypothetical protein
MLAIRNIYNLIIKAARRAELFYPIPPIFFGGIE